LFISPHRENNSFIWRIIGGGDISFIFTLCIWGMKALSFNRSEHRLLYVLPASTFKVCEFCWHTVFMHSVRFSQQQSFSLKALSILAFIMKQYSSEVHTRVLNIMYMNFRLHRLKKYIMFQIQKISMCRQPMNFATILIQFSSGSWEKK
jgi:hypothetical protein